MSKILIDNSTISSVQRALGKAPLKEPALLDIEQVSLSRFCDAVLLNDEIIVPDNYKTELTPARKKLLDNEVFTFEPLNQNEDEDLIKISSSMTDLWSEAFRSGSDRSLFSEYFSQIDAFSNFVWEHSSSEFFLVFRAHGISKESPLIEAVLASPKSEDLGKQLKIYAQDGVGVSWDKLSRHVRRMLSVMGWLGSQYIWHQVFSAQHESTYIPHPLRDFFSYDFLNRVNLGSHNSASFADAFTKGVGKFQGKLKESLDKLGVIDSSATISLPGMLPLLVRESSSGKDFLNVLYQLRDESEVIELRQMLSQVQNSIDSGNFKPLTKLTREIEGIGNNILLERGFEEKFITISPPTTILGIDITGEDSGIKLPIPTALYKQYFLGRKYRSFVKRVMEELAAFSKYGELKDKLNGYAWIKEDKFSKFYLKEDQFSSKFHKEFTKATPE